MISGLFEVDVDIEFILVVFKISFGDDKFICIDVLEDKDWVWEWMEVY